MRQVYLPRWTVFTITIAVAAAGGVAVIVTAGNAVFNPAEYIPILVVVVVVVVVVISVFLVMIPKASCGCSTSIRRMVEGVSLSSSGGSNMGLKNSEGNLGFGNAIITTVLGVSLEIAISLWFLVGWWMHDGLGVL